MSTQPNEQHHPSRRTMLAGALAITCWTMLAHRALADADGLAEAMTEALGQGYVLNDGRVKITVPELAENGNAVPLRVSVESPMTAQDHVKTIFVFSEKNPNSNVVRFHLGPRSGQARVHTNIRMAATQHITVVARMSNGDLWAGAAQVIVTQGACIDDT